MLAWNTQNAGFISEGHERNAAKSLLLPICLTNPDDMQHMTRFKKAPLVLYRRKWTLMRRGTVGWIQHAPNMYKLICKLKSCRALDNTVAKLSGFPNCSFAACYKANTNVNKTEKAKLKSGGRCLCYVPKEGNNLKWTSKHWRKDIKNRACREKRNLLRNQDYA